MQYFPPDGGTNIGFGLELKGMKKSQIKEEVDTIMATMGLSALVHVSPVSFRRSAAARRLGKGYCNQTQGSFVR
jgi:ABC-type taurine transport system ATPase subunit